MQKTTKILNFASKLVDFTLNNCSGSDRFYLERIEKSRCDCFDKALQVYLIAEKWFTLQIINDKLGLKLHGIIIYSMQITEIE